MPTVKTISGTSAHNALGYVLGEDGDRPVFVAGQYADANSTFQAIRDFKELRKEYGRDGEKVRMSGRYVTQDGLETLRAAKHDHGDDARGLARTHIIPDAPTDGSVERPMWRKRGKNWIYDKSGGTHYRLEPVEREKKAAEVWHDVVSFAADEVDIDDPAACAEAFQWTVDSYRERYPGLQFVAAAHDDSDGQKFHVHVVKSTIVAADFDMVDEARKDGIRHYRAGQRLSGVAANVDAIRDSSDDYLAAHGRDHGLAPQQLARVDSEEYKRLHLNKAEQKGHRTDATIMRDAADEALTDLNRDPRQLRAAADDDERIEVFAGAVAATGHGTVRTRVRRGRLQIQSYRRPGKTQGPTKKQLGEAYSTEGILHQLDQIQAGTWEPVRRQSAGDRLELGPVYEEQVEQAQQAINDLARGEYKRVREAQRERAEREERYEREAEQWRQEVDEAYEREKAEWPRPRREADHQTATTVATTTTGTPATGRHGAPTAAELARRTQEHQKAATRTARTAQKEAQQAEQGWDITD